jgi:PAS domain S-box-containing protein
MGLQKSIPRTFLFNMVLMTSVSCLLVGFAWIFQEYHRFNHEAASMRETHVENRKLHMRERVDNAVDFIQYKRLQTEQRTRQILEERVREAHALATHLYETHREAKTREEVEILVRETLRPIRFNEGRGYYFATRLDGVEMLFADRPELEGKNLHDKRDTHGAYVIRDMIELVKDRGEGFYSYTWTKPGSTSNMHLKISFIKLFEPFDWLIGAGEYPEDVEEDLKREGLDWIKNIQYENDEYIFASKWDGLCLTRPAEGRNMIDTVDANGVKVVQELVAKAKQGGGFVSYVMPKLEGLRPDPKISYVKGVPEWEWYIGTGEYIDDIERAVLEYRDAGLKGLKKDVGMVVLGLCLLGLGSFLMAHLVARRTRAAFSAFSEFFNQTAAGRLDATAKGLEFAEFEVLANAANDMISKRQEAEREARDAREFFEAALAQSPAGILIAEPSPPGIRVRLANRAALGLRDGAAGLLRGDELRRHIAGWQILRSDGSPYPAGAAPLSRAILQGETVRGEEAIIRDGDADRAVIANAAPIRDAEGRVVAGIVVFEDISERKKVEEETRAREKFLRTVIQTSADGFWVINTKGIVTEVNDAYCRMSGFSRDELLGRSIAEVDADEVPEVTEARMRRIVRNGSELFETHHRRKNGDVFPVEISASWIESEGGRFVCFCRDQTERRERDERIALLGRMLDAAPVSITVHAPDGRFLYANEATLSLHGYALMEEFLAVNLRELDVLDDKEELKRRCQKVVEDGEARFEVSRRRKDGSTFPLDVVAKSIQWEGRPAVLSIATDISARKKAEDALRESEARFQNMLGAVPDMLSIHDPDMNILYSNWQGFGAVPMEKRKLRTKCHWTYRGMDDICPDCAARTVLETRTPFQREVKLPDGSWVDLRVIPFLDAEGRVELFMEWVRDITAHKKGEEERERLRNQLGQAQKMESVGRLAGGVAHDFNNMLNVILGYADIILNELPESSPQRVGLGEIHKAAQRSADLTRQLLAFARKQTVAPKVLDLNKTVESMLKMLSRLIGEDIELLWEPGAELDPIRVDPAQIDQLLANLVVNARDAIGSRQGRVAIETRAVSLNEAECAEHPDSTPGDYVMLAVSDNGCGMDEETRAHIFEPFFTTKGVGEGTGLGLATVYGVVKQNMGFIDVQSEPGAGTSFRIYLPVYRSGAIRDERERESEAAERGHETVLLVEDEPAILKMTKMMLERLGYRVIPASTPGEAIQLAEERADEIHLLMTDVVMPEMNGRDLAKRLLSLHPMMRRLFMSGYTADVIAHHGVLDEGVNFIQKPFSMRDLGRKIREALGRL